MQSMFSRSRLLLMFILTPHHDLIKSLIVTSFQGRIAAQGSFQDIIELDDTTTLPDSASPRKTKQGKVVEEENRTVLND